MLEIPWKNKNPPVELVRIIESELIVGTHVLDVGCGAGNYSIYLARKGFTVTGLDKSHRAISFAKKYMMRENIRCNFYVLDIVKEFDEFTGLYNFIFDWKLLHHIFPENRPRYVKNIDRLLNDGCYYLSVCFNEVDAHFNGQGKIRETKLGNRLYFSSKDELETLFPKFFKIIQLKILKYGIGAEHIGNFVLMQKEY